MPLTRTIWGVPHIGLVDQLLPPPVVCAESFVDPPEAVLFPEEEAVIARAVPKRRHEFTTARHCARTALARLGAPPVPILPGAKGAPTWPAGYVGTMTHCIGYRAAAVARTDRVASIGLDAEPHQPLPSGVLPLVTLPEERDWLTEYGRDRPDVHWDRLLFCTKEAVYKGWFPLAQRWLGFQDALITVDPDGTFEARLLVDGPKVHGGEPLTTFQGRWLVSDGLILTSTLVWRPHAVRRGSTVEVVAGER
jgi:4'-phosphopantetheinyl transferase EntD